MEFFTDDNLDSQDTPNLENTEHFENTENSGSPTGTPQSFPNVFALFAKSLGAFSIFCAVFSVFFGSFICGGLAIVLAILSKGYNTKMEKNARIGLITGTIGIILQISLLAFSIYNVIHVPEFREQFNSLYEQMYGEPADESINELLDKMGVSSSEGGIL